MKNEALKQASILVNALDLNDSTIEDVVITIKMKNDSIYKIMNDGSIVLISDNANKAFANASEVIRSFDDKSKKMHDAEFDIIIPRMHLNKIDDSTMKVVSVDDTFAYLTYRGSDCEEPETIANDIRLKYGIRPTSITRK